MENPVCSVFKNSDNAKVLQESVFLVWDECNRAKKVFFETVERTLRRSKSND